MKRILALAAPAITALFACSQPTREVWANSRSKSGLPPFFLSLILGLLLSSPISPGARLFSQPAQQAHVQQGG